MPASSSATPKCPISTVPHDVLREIFLYCITPVRHTLVPHSNHYLTGHFYDETDPIDLCQVCATWRMVALTFPSLWNYFNRSLTVLDSDSFPLEMPAIEYAFLSWWRENQGRMPPSLSLGARRRADRHLKPTGAADEKRKLDLHEMISLFDYATSAHELCLAETFWRRIQQAIDIGYRISFPNLRTLLYHDESEVFYDVQSSMPEDSAPLLRHLIIMQSDLPRAFIVPRNWRTLTHILFCESVYVPFTSWFTLIRGLPNLQWADVHFLITHYESPINPEMYTHSQLLILTIAININEKDVREEFSYSLLFSHLQLPTLNHLTLYASDAHEAWEDDRGMTDILTVLKSTPAITNLFLGPRFLCSDMQIDSMIQILLNATEPIWTNTPHLARLILTPNLEAEETQNGVTLGQVLMAHFLIRGAFTRTRWLDLKNPLCPLRRIILCVDDYRLGYGESTVVRIPKFPNVIFKILNSQDDEFTYANPTIDQVNSEGNQLDIYAWP